MAVGIVPEFEIVVQAAVVAECGVPGVRVARIDGWRRIGARLELALLNRRSALVAAD